MFSHFLANSHSANKHSTEDQPPSKKQRLDDPQTEANKQQTEEELDKSIQSKFEGESVVYYA